MYASRVLTPMLPPPTVAIRATEDGSDILQGSSVGNHLTVAVFKRRPPEREDPAFAVRKLTRQPGEMPVLP
jgi:hypothetical protein